MASKALDLDVTCLIFPTYLLLTFGGSNAKPSPIHNRIHVFAGAQGLDCYKLYLVDSLIDKLAEKEIFFEDAEQQLENIISLNALYPWYVNLLAFSLLGFAVSIVSFKTTWTEAFISMLLSFLSGLIALSGTYAPALARVSGFLSAMMCSIVSASFSNAGIISCFGAVTFSGVLWNLPGLTITVAVLELSNRAMVAGTSRFFYAILNSLQIGFGIAIGMRIGQFDSAITTSCDGSLRWYDGPFFFVMIICYNILLRSSLSQWPGMLLVSSLCYSVSLLSSKIFGFGTDTTTALSAYYYYI